MQNKLLVILFISMVSFGYTANGQKLINSPYSRFNIGTLQPEGSFRSLAMGGTSIGMRRNNSINYSNPASYSSLDTNSFVFDFGVDYGRNLIPENGSSYTSSDLNFHHLVMGFPLSKGWGLAFGIVPVSSGYYSITGEVKTTSPDYDPNIGEYAIDHNGDGGITKFFIGTGLKITRNFSVGANLTFLSGQLNRTNQFVFGDFTTVFHDKSTESLVLNGFNLDYGLQYSATLKNNYFLNIGASVSAGSNYNSKYNQLSTKFTAFSSVDTITYTSDNNTKTFLPSSWKVGISFGKKNKFTTGLDYIITKWSSSKIPGSDGYAADTKTFLFGMEYIPDRFSNYSFINRIEYRIGAHVGNNYLIINNEQIKEYGASAGLGLPIKKSYSAANLYIDYTRKSGSLSNGLHNENLITVGISLNFYDYWFQKKKYD